LTSGAVRALGIHEEFTKNGASRPWQDLEGATLRTPLQNFSAMADGGGKTKTTRQNGNTESNEERGSNCRTAIAAIRVLGGRL